MDKWSLIPRSSLLIIPVGFGTFAIMTLDLHRSNDRQRKCIGYFDVVKQPECRLQPYIASSTSVKPRVIAPLFYAGLVSARW